MSDKLEASHTPELITCGGVELVVIQRGMQMGCCPLHGMYFLDASDSICPRREDHGGETLKFPCLFRPVEQVLDNQGQVWYDVENEAGA